MSFPSTPSTNSGCRLAQFDQNIDLSGLTLTGQNLFGPNAEHTNEGGAFNFFNGELNMNDVTVANSSTIIGDGGGIAFLGEQLNMSDVTVMNSTATSGDGGGLALSGGQLNMNDVTVTDSSTINGDGGGIAIFTAENVTITNSTVLAEFRLQHGHDPGCRWRNLHRSPTVRSNGRRSRTLSSTIT